VALLARSLEPVIADLEDVLDTVRLPD